MKFASTKQVRKVIWQVVKEKDIILREREDIPSVKTWTNKIRGNNPKARMVIFDAVRYFTATDIAHEVYKRLRNMGFYNGFSRINNGYVAFYAEMK
jgi:hypothetical protein